MVQGFKLVIKAAYQLERIHMYIFKRTFEFWQKTLKTWNSWLQVRCAICPPALRHKDHINRVIKGHPVVARWWRTYGVSGLTMNFEVCIIFGHNLVCSFCAMVYVSVVLDIFLSVQISFWSSHPENFMLFMNRLF